MRRNSNPPDSSPNCRFAEEDLPFCFSCTEIVKLRRISKRRDHCKLYCTCTINREDASDKKLKKEVEWLENSIQT